MNNRWLQLVNNTASESAEVDVLCLPSTLTNQMVARLAICVRWLMLITLMALLGGGEARRLSNNPRGAFITPRSRTLGSVGGARSGGRCERRLAGDRRRSQQPLEASATQPDDVRTDDCALDANAGLAFAAGACVCM